MESAICLRSSSVGFQPVKEHSTQAGSLRYPATPLPSYRESQKISTCTIQFAFVYAFH